ncbi:MAG: MarR family winged helix-turn-helix transcriptional regulator [Streptosporangiaceae bacterium]
MNAVLWASRAMVAIAVRSLSAGTDDVTLPQYRVLVLLAGGARKSANVAASLGVTASAGSRMCDRLVRKGLIRRWHDHNDRRIVWLALRSAGRQLVAEVTERRRTEITAVAARLPEAQKQAAAVALRAFAAAAGETPDQDWWLGWELSEEKDGDTTMTGAGRK